MKDKWALIVPLAALVVMLGSGVIIYIASQSGFTISLNAFLGIFVVAILIAGCVWAIGGP